MDIKTTCEIAGANGVTYEMGGGWKDMISSYSSSLSCSRLMSSLCTEKGGFVSAHARGGSGWSDSRSNSKNSGSRGGAHGSSSGSCWADRPMSAKSATDMRIDAHMPQGMGAQARPLL